jgi:hypothetical protein
MKLREKRDRSEFVPFKGRSYSEIIRDIRKENDSFLMGAAKTTAVGVGSTLFARGIFGRGKISFLLQRVLREAFELYQCRRTARRTNDQRIQDRELRQG